MRYGGCGDSGDDIVGDIFGCIFLKGAEGGAGATMALTGLVWLLAEAAAQPDPEPPPASLAPLPASSPSPAWPTPSMPSRSPSTPSGARLGFD
jgi:hypothetical protein